MKHELKLLGAIREVPRAVWDELVGEDGSPFLEWTWLDCLEEAGCVGDSTGWLPQHLALFVDGTLVAAAPAYVKGHSFGEFVYDWAWADLAGRLRVPYYPKLVFAVPFTPATGARVIVRPGFDKKEAVALFARAARNLGDALALGGVHVLFPDVDEASLWEREGYLMRTAIQYHWRNDGYISWDDFLARAFASKRRNAIRREVAQPARDGIHIETLPASALTAPIAHAMHDLYGRTVDKFTWGQRYLNARFFELVCERFAHRLSWVVARREEAVVAGAFNVKKGRRLYGRYWGSRVDSPFLHFNVCYYHGVRQCIEEGLLAFEPGAGGEHKRPRGFLPTLTYSNHFLRSERLTSILAAHLERERALVEEEVARERDQS